MLLRGLDLTFTLHHLIQALRSGAFAEHSVEGSDTPWLSQTLNCFVRQWGALFPRCGVCYAYARSPKLDPWTIQTWLQIFLFQVHTQMSASRHSELTTAVDYSGSTTIDPFQDSLTDVMLEHLQKVGEVAVFPNLTSYQ